MTIAAVLCCAMTTTLFTACGDDDDDNTKKPQDTPATCAMDCTLYTDDETLVNFDFNVKYYDENGQVQSEKPTWEPANSEGYRTWKKKVTAKLPASLGVLLEINAKDGLDMQKKYRITTGQKMVFTSYTTSGVLIDSYIPTYAIESLQNKEGLLEAYLNEHSKAVDILCKYDSNGKPTTSKW